MQRKSAAATPLQPEATIATTSTAASIKPSASTVRSTPPTQTKTDKAVSISKNIKSEKFKDATTATTTSTADTKPSTTPTTNTPTTNTRPSAQNSKRVKKVTITVDENTTVAILKTMFAAQYGLPTKKIAIVQNGKKLQNGHLIDLNILPHVILKGPFSSRTTIEKKNEAPQETKKEPLSPRRPK